MGEKSINWKAIMMIAGAFISYTIGAGFASGNEVLQFFGSWGSGSVLAVIGGLLYTAVFLICLFLIGQKVEVAKTSDYYTFFGGKILGWFFQIFVLLFVLGCFMLMFSGAGSLGNQFYGLPQWVGSVALGVITAIIVLGGLKAVENVLGYAGMVILAYVVIFGVVALFHPAADFAQASGAADAVAAGQIWQANLFELPPLNAFPALSGMNGPFLEGLMYGGICLLTGFPFYITLARNLKSRKEVYTAAAATSIAFYACVGFVLVILLSNFNSLINSATGSMFPFPTVAGITAMWPGGAWTYVVIVFVGIFTTASGYLWVLGDMFIPGSEGTNKSRIFIAAMLLIGLGLGGIIPFSALINFMFPLAGLVGIVFIIALIIKTVKVVQQEGTEAANQK